MNWIIILAVILIAAILFVKLRTAKHNMNVVLIAILVVVLAASLLYVYGAHGADLGSFDGLVEFGRVYLSWVGGVFRNFVSISGYAINQNWGVNSTIGKLV